jgi:uncharacterized protein (DUF2062 family)
MQKFKEWLNKLYTELTSAKEPVHNVALSFGIGVMLGILPFTGVLAAIAVAMAFRLNKAAAILGSAITNTWVGIITFALSIKFSTLFSALPDEEIKARIDDMFKNFEWGKIFSHSSVDLILPVLIAFIVISLILSVLAYFLAFSLISWHRARQEPRP